MTIEELRKEPHLSYSQIVTYLNCSLKYKFNYIDHLPPDFIPLSLVFGSAIHASLAQFYQGVLESERPDATQIQEFFTQTWNAAQSDKINFGKTTPEAVLDQGKAMLACFCESVKPETVVAIEQPFKLDIQGTPPLIGAMDLIEMDEDCETIIVDHKTSASKYSEQDVKKDLQMSLYSLAALNIGFGHNGLRLRFDVLIKTKTPQFQQCRTRREDKDHLRAIKIVQEVWKAISAGIFIANDENGFCSGCQYQSYCADWN
jgi:putative RecB family exonuclease